MSEVEQASPSGRPGFLATEVGSLYTVLHEPASGPRRGAVLVCAPFGWEDVLSYRPRRALAVALAERGHPVLRFDLPGTGESAPLPAGDAVPAWIAAVTAAAAALEDRAGPVTVVGLGLGGLLACAAVSEGAPVQDLALWAVPGRGATLLRELRAFSLLQDRPDEGAAEGERWFNGYPMGPATLATLGALDLRDRDLRAGRALVMGRGSLPADKALLEALGSREVTTGPGEGWDDLHDVANASLPSTALEALAAWLPHHDQQKGPWTTESSTDGTELVDLDGMAAAITRPTADPDDLCTVYLSAGGTRRTGPSRLWRAAAEADARKGVTAVRLDVLGVGDSGGPLQWSGGDRTFYEESAVAEVSSALDALAAQGVPRRFALVGLCSGAFWAFRVGQTDPRVVGVTMLNPKTLRWHEGLADVRTSQDARRLLRVRTWRRVLTGQASWRHAGEVLRALLRRAVRRSTADDRDVARGFDLLRATAVAVTLAFSPGEPLERELEPVLAGHGQAVHHTRLSGPPGAHTLAPPVLQQQALDLLSATRDRLH